MMNLFDEHIKKTLENLAPEVPENAWQKIMTADSGNRRRGLLFIIRSNRWLSSVLILLLLGFALVFGNHLLRRGRMDVATNSLSSEKDDSSKKTVSGSQNILLPSSLGTGSAAANTASESLVNTDDLVVKNATEPAPVIAGRAASTHSERNNKIIMQTSDRTNASRVRQHRINGDMNTEIVTAESQRNHYTSGRSRVNVSNSKLEDEAFEDKNGPGTSAASFRGLTKRYLQPDIRISEAAAPATVTNINLLPLNIPCPVTGKPFTGKRNYVEVYGGPDYAFRSFRDTGNSVYLRKRKESTSFTSAYSFGVRYTKIFGNRVSIRTGLNFSQINERFKYESGQMLQNVFIINGQGDTTGSYTATTSRYKVTHNRYRTLDIPILIGYEAGGERLCFNFNAGPVINIYSWQKGDLLDKDNQPVNISTGSSNSPYKFKTNAGLGIAAAASIYYKWRGNLYFLAEPWYRHNFSAANRADITLKQKYSTTGLRLGIRMNF